MSSCFQYSSLLLMRDWFSGHVSFTLPGNFCIQMAAVSAQQPGMGTHHNCHRQGLLIGTENSKDRIVLDGKVLDRIEQNITILDRTLLYRTGLDRTVLDGTVLDWTELDIILLDKTVLHGQSSTVQNSTGQNITVQHILYWITQGRTVPDRRVQDIRFLTEQDKTKKNN